MNQFFYQITRKASELINSNDYRERNITKQTAFTRNRKLTFPVMIVLLLNFLTRTMQIELDDFFANVLDASTDSVTKQAFFKARKNILPDAFKELFLMTRDMVLNKNKIKRHIMSPIYWGIYAPEMETALTGFDFSGKTVRVISTHEGSGLGSMVSDVKKMCKGASVDSKGLAIVGSKAKASKNTVADWL